GHGRGRGAREARLRRNPRPAHDNERGQGQRGPLTPDRQPRAPAPCGLAGHSLPLPFSCAPPPLTGCYYRALCVAPATLPSHRRRLVRLPLQLLPVVLLRQEGEPESRDQCDNPEIDTRRG